MKRALVLAGGGSRGAYELGAWSALNEENQSFDLACCGTSIGAINAALVVQGDYDLAAQLWKTITVDQVMEDGINLELSIESVIRQRDKLAPFLKRYLTTGGADITPLIQLLKRTIDEKKVRASALELGIVTVTFPQLKPVELTLGNIPEGKLVDFIIASASCFPAFPIHKIDGQGYIDGGYYDNLPIDLAVKMGAQELVAVDLSPNPTHSKYLNVPYVTSIIPSWDLGSFLLFDQKVMSRNTTLGYNDTKKVLGRYDGFRYTFDPASAPKGSQVRRFVDAAARYEAEVPMESAPMLLTGSSQAQLLAILAEHTGGRRLSQRQLFLRGCEVAAELVDFDPLYVYRLEDLNRKLLEKFQDTKRFQDGALTSKLSGAQSVTSLKDFLRGMDSVHLCGSLYAKLVEGGSDAVLRRAAIVLPRELVAALYLWSISPQI